MGTLAVVRLTGRWGFAGVDSGTPPAIYLNKVGVRTPLPIPKHAGR